MAEDRIDGFGITGERGSNYEIMSPGNGLSLDLGPKHAIALLATKNDACHLTLVLADSGGASGEHWPGARIVVPLVPGNALQVDTADGKSAEFSCGAGGTRMDARVLDRPPVKS
jgi:hypothetical protein